MLDSVGVMAQRQHSSEMWLLGPPTNLECALALVLKQKQEVVAGDVAVQFHPTYQAGVKHLGYGNYDQLRKLRLGFRMAQQTYQDLMGVHGTAQKEGGIWRGV